MSLCRRLLDCDWKATIIMRRINVLEGKVRINISNYSGPFWLWTIMGKGLPSFDKEGMPGSDSGPAFLDHPVLDFVSATPPHPRRGVQIPRLPRS
jgi:hypothetical protein